MHWAEPTLQVYRRRRFPRDCSALIQNPPFLIVHLLLMLA